MNKTKPILFYLIVIFFIYGCEKPFQFSPYQATVNSNVQNTTQKNIERLKNSKKNKDSFSFAVISDNHYHYDNLKKVLNHINENSKIDFVVFGGDIADQGLLQEFESFHSILHHLNKPYFTVIGNHDYLSNGEVIYKKMFGSYNYTFEYNKCKFIFWDNIVWESYKIPDFAWLKSQLYKGDYVNKLFVVSHIPPFTDQFTDEMENEYKSLMSDNNVDLSIHGHIHHYSLGNFYQDKVQYLTVPWLKEPTYITIHVGNNGISIEQVRL